MNNYDFKYANTYLGYWNVPNIGRKVPGTLFVEKYSIRLELFWNNVTHRDVRVILSATGYAYTELDNKKLCYYFVLKGLQLISISWFGKHQSQYKLDINYICMSDKPRFSSNGILNCCIRTRLMDKWVWDYTQSSYSNLWPFKENDSIDFKYNSHPSLILYDSSLYNLYIKFGHGALMPNASGFCMSTNSFLNLSLKKRHNFYDALDLTESIIWLLSLLWDNQFNPDFIEFRTTKNTFIYKQSARYSYKYRNVTNTNINTSISDFDDGKLFSIIEKWFDIVNKERLSIGTFFETLYNEHISPSSTIKNFVSVIDGLSKDIEVESDGCTKDVKKKHWFESLSKKIEDRLSRRELNELKMAVLKESQKEIKVRFYSFCKKLQGFVPIILESDFCSKVIDTRNMITHTKGVSNIVYSKEKYWEVSMCLEKIIQAYLLKAIGVPSTVAIKIVGEIKFDKE